MLMEDIFEYAHKHDCNGCPIKNLGVLNYGSCDFRLYCFYENNRDVKKTNEFILWYKNYYGYEDKELN